MAKQHNGRQLISYHFFYVCWELQFRVQLNRILTTSSLEMKPNSKSLNMLHNIKPRDEAQQQESQYAKSQA